MSYLTELLVQRNRKQERHTASWLISISTGPKRRQGFVVVSSKINHRSFRSDPNLFSIFRLSFLFFFFKSSIQNVQIIITKNNCLVRVINPIEEKKFDKIYDLKLKNRNFQLNIMKKKKPLKIYSNKKFIVKYSIILRLKNFEENFSKKQKKKRDSLGYRFRLGHSPLQDPR